MGEFSAIEGLGPVGPLIEEQRDRARMYAANWVRRVIPQRWDDSKAELHELLDELGILRDELPGYRARVRGCDPVGPSSKRKLLIRRQA